MQAQEATAKVRTMVSTAGGRTRHDRGAAAVEFAIILPLLLLILGGIVDFGRAMYTQSILTNAAREGARVAVMGAEESDVVERTKAGLPGDPSDPDSFAGQAQVPPVSCTGDDVTVQVSIAFDWIIVEPMMNFFGAADSLPDPLASSATMRCGG